MSLLPVELVVRVNPLGLLVGSLLSLSHHVVLGHNSGVSLHFPVFEDLHSALVLELKSVSLLLVNFLFGLELLFS